MRHPKSHIDALGHEFGHRSRSALFPGKY
jgi:hypothetical protein